ncbi:MAG: enoyl-CoA hydratase-related protein [Janthinobacterium lividum]
MAPRSGDFIRTETAGHLLIVTLDRPQVMNSLHAPACHELSAVWDAFQADPDLWVAIITGSGDKAFCAGHDLADGFDDPMPDTGWAGMAERADITKPIIAAVNGYALGGGMEIALCSDIVIADERARFGLTEPRVGFAALGGGAARLTLRMPPAIAMGLLLTGKKIDAAEAHRWGLVNEVVPAGTVMAAARRWADEILLCSPLAVRATKQVALDALEGQQLLSDIGRRREQLGGVLRSAEDTREGIKAFLEKRKPAWKGR